MNYLKQLLSSLKCLVYILIEMGLVFLITFLYACYNQERLEYYIIHHVSIISIVINIILIVFLIKKYHIKINSPSLKKNYPYIYFAVSFTIFFNLLTILNGKAISNKYNIYILIISTCIIGPILEEIIFRKLLCDSLNKFNNKKSTILISSLIFSVIHLDLIKSLYAFIVGLVYGTLYQKNKNIIDSIVAHTASNLIVLLIHNFDKTTFILSIFCMLISISTILISNTSTKKTCKIMSSWYNYYYKIKGVYHEKNISNNIYLHVFMWLWKQRSI